ncbi:MAG: AraC family transcriptional regulator [Chloroflexi bacterium]|nr:AraC family transcriptional regulator [Chloroflexota bacterium]
MDYRVYPPHLDLASLVKCYWTLEVPAAEGDRRQRIIPDGCLEMAFLLGDDIKRYTSDDEFVIQPRAMVIGQITEAFFIKPTGYVNTFAVRFYPYGLANFLSTPIKELANKETPLTVLFGEERASALAQRICQAEDTESRIAIVEAFLFEKLKDPIAIDNIVKATINTMFLTSGALSIKEMLDNHAANRRQLERKFTEQVGISPKQLCRVIRLQSALNMLLHQPSESMSQIAYDSDYYDQAHFTKDFKEFTGMTPKEFFKLDNEEMALSLQFYG